MADKEKGNDKDLFDELSSAEPPRDVVFPEAEGEGDDGGHATISERMEGSPKLTDVQIVIRQLFPDLGVKWLNALMMARVLPEYYVHLKRILIKHLVRTMNMSVAEAIATIEVAVGIPIDGEGRIDAIAVMGRAAEAEETKAKNEVGLP